MRSKKEATRTRPATTGDTTNTSVSTLDRLRAQIGANILGHLPGIDKLKFEDDHRKSNKYYSAALRVGEYVPLYAWAWTYCRIKDGRPTWRVYLYDYEGQNEYFASTQEEMDIYNPGKGLRMTHAAFGYDDEFLVCENTQQIQIMALYIFLLHAEQAKEKIPEVTITDEMIDTIKRCPRDTRAKMRGVRKKND